MLLLLLFFGYFLLFFNIFIFSVQLLYAHKYPHTHTNTHMERAVSLTECWIEGGAAGWHNEINTSHHEQHRTTIPNSTKAHK